MQTIKLLDQELKVNLRDIADVSVMREIFKFREYKAADDVIVSARDPIVDVGAHVGLFTMYCRLLNPKVKIFAIEPEENNLKALKDHLKSNNLKEIEIVAGVLAGNTGERGLKISKDSHNHSLVEDITDEVDGLKVRSYSLPDFCTKYKIKIISLLKMDIEGSEFEIFESLAPVDFLLFKNVILEYHNSRLHACETIENRLRENGFGVQNFPSKFDKTMGFIFAHNKRLK